MSETKNIEEDKTDQESFYNIPFGKSQIIVRVRYYINEGTSIREINSDDLANRLPKTPIIGVPEPYITETLENRLTDPRFWQGSADATIRKFLGDARNAAVHGLLDKSANVKHYELSELARELLNSQAAMIPLQIDVESLTPHTLALTFTALTELTTKLWLISQHRFADLIEYTQTHDARFANEAGVTIAYVTYYSPFSFGLNVDLSATNVADATMTIVDGLAQRKAKREQLDINNQATAQKIKEAEEALKQQQEMAELEREKREIELETLRLENQKERQVLIEQRLESQMKQIEYALEFAGKAIDIVYPNGDPEIRPILIQTLVNNILQLDSVGGLQLALPAPNKTEPSTKEDTGPITGPAS